MFNDKNNFSPLSEAEKKQMENLLLKSICELMDFITFDRLIRLSSSITWSEEDSGRHIQYEVSVNKVDNHYACATITVCAAFCNLLDNQSGAMKEYCIGSLIECKKGGMPTFTPVHEVITFT